MTFRLTVACFITALTILLSFSCKRNHDGEVYCELKPLQTKQGWGYEIFVDKKLYIKQEFIPAISGIHPFKSKDDAMRTGALVLQKLTHGKVPALTIDELKNLNVIQ